MAVSKLWPVTVRLATVLDYASNPEKTTKSKSKYSDADYQALRDVVAYAKDGEKTERELFCEGIHCNPQTAREQFITVKEQFDKPDGIQAYHGYLSFEETDITPELAQRVGMAFAERMWGDRFQVLVTTHLNTEHLHCHFVVNSVSFRDGKRLQNKEKAWWYFRHIADEVCLEHGLSVVQNPEAYQSPRILTQKDKAGMPTRYNLARAALDEAIAMSHNLRQLEYHLSEMGYTLGSNPKRKYWTIKGKGDERPIRLHRLGDEYTKERITQRLIENRDNIDFEPFQPKIYRPKQYRLRTRSDRIGKVGGLYGLYLYYCYRLGYLPKYKAGQQNHARVHYLFKEDLMKIDELTKQVTLLGKHHIGTDEQLFSYQHSVEEQVKTLTADRTHLRNEIRKVNITDAELSQAKASISLLTEKLKELRKEVKLCQDIAIRSKVIEEKVGAVRAEEEKSKRKENRNYAVKTNTDTDNPQEVATMDESKKQILSDIFWEMNSISSRSESHSETEITETDDGNGNIVQTETTVTKTTLYITVSHLTVDEMADLYGFDAEQREYLAELLKDKNNSLWAAVLYGIRYSDDQIVTVALSQVGNVGGEPYWSWYGFGSRVEWCACFVSWCADQCGYIDTGVVPKYAGCVNGVQWFKDRGQWIDGSAEPVPGMIIFFDWDNKGSSGPQDGQSDHTGIVQKVENGIVYTVEGNSGDSCRVNQYSVGHYEILGYGVPQY